MSDKTKELLTLAAKAMGLESVYQISMALRSFTEVEE